jgi:hypothetical protein
VIGVDTSAHLALVSLALQPIPPTAMMHCRHAAHYSCAQTQHDTWRLGRDAKELSKFFSASVHFRRREPLFENSEPILCDAD